MPENPSGKSIHDTPKRQTAHKMVDYIDQKYSPFKSPILLMWRELMNGYFLSSSPDYPIWRRDDGTTHHHWRRFGPSVIKELRHKYKVTIVTVNGHVRDYLDHEKSPDRGSKQKVGKPEGLTDAWYRSCIPHSGNRGETRGFVVFPRDAQQDHPLIISSLDRRGKTAATGLKNSVVSINTANDLGNISDNSRNEIREHMEVIVRRAVEDKMPLFPRKSLKP